MEFPIAEALSAAGDSGTPLVAKEPTSETAQQYGELGATVVREVAKLARAPKNVVRYDAEFRALAVRLPNELDGDGEFWLDPAVVRRNDTSALSINEWTGEKMLNDADIPDDVTPAAVNPLGNYAVQIGWEDGFNQVATYDLLATLERLEGEALAKRGKGAVTVGGAVAAMPDLD